MQTEKTVPKPKKRSFLRRFGLWSVVVILVLLVGGSISVLGMMGRTLVAPDWVRTEIVTRVNTATPDINIELGSIELILDHGWQPQARVRDVRVNNAAGASIVEFSEADVQLAMGPLLRGEVKPKSISVSGVFATLLRDVDGTVSLRGGADLSGQSRTAANLAELIEQLDTIFQVPELSALRTARVQALTLRYEDSRAQRVWVADGGRLRLDHDGDQLTLGADLAVLDGGSGVSTLEVNYTSKIGDQQASFGVNISDIAAQDIALQNPAFAWMTVLRAPISGSVRSGVGTDGTLAPLNATLQIGAGVVQPNEAAQPIPFQSARSYFTYRPENQIIDFDQLSIVSQWLTAEIDGQASLIGLDNGLLKELVGQFQLSNLALNPNGLYAEAIQLDRADMDFQMRLDPFDFRIGRLQIVDQGKNIEVDGDFTTDDEGWSYAVNGQVDGVSPDRLLTLWPENVAAPTRNWISANLLAGNMTNLDVALRGGENHATNAFVGFNFDSADVRYLKTLPPVKNASGHASLVSNRFVAAIENGSVLAPQGGLIDVAGSAFIIPDVTIKGRVVGEVKLASKSTVTAALSLLNQPKLEVMDKAGLPVSLADGRAEVTGNITFPMRRGTKFQDIKYTAQGKLLSIKVDGLVADKRIASDQLELAATNSGVRIWGPGRIGNVGFDAEWSQAIGAGQAGNSQIKGTVELSELLIDEFDIGLPTGTLIGAAVGELTLQLAKDTPPTIALTSNLRGVRVRIPALGWTKAAGDAGLLQLSGRLGAAPVIDELVLDAPGLSARGSITTTAGGGLDKARFSRVTVGNWLRAPVVLTGQGKGAPMKIDVSGGSLDLRRAEFGQGGGQGGGDGGPMNLKLDNLQITDTLALTDMRGTFTTKNGLDGKFSAGLNGGTQIQGQILPQNGRSAVKVTSNNAGGVFASAGLLKQARDGDLTLTLLPVGSGGAFDGDLRVTNTRIKDAPAIAALLNALSIVGILEQMNGSGIHFSEVEAAFRLTPSTMTLTRASAVGPSMGISMDGIYAVDKGTLDMQGVVSPLFLLNGIGSFLTRKGEGLIGFNYTLRGPAKSPKVGVNPLSVFTPGMFREVFRSPAPKVAQPSGTAPERNIFEPSPTTDLTGDIPLSRAERRRLDLNKDLSGSDR